MTKKTFLVTGGAGFIGSNLVDALLLANHRVVVLDDLSVGKRANFAHHISNPDFEFIQGSVLDMSVVDRLVAAVDGVYHLAAVVGVTYVVQNPLHGILVNSKGTENVFAAAHKYRRKVLFASTSEIFGKSTQVPFKETDNSVFGPTSVPRWAYALAKALDEQLAFAYYRQEGLPVTVIRYFNAYGPRLDPRGYGSVIARFITQALAGQPLTVYGDGQQTRSFTFVKDSVRGTMAAMDFCRGEGMAFNIGNPEEVTIATLAHHIQQLVNPDLEIVHIPYEQAYGKNFEETRRRLPDVSRAAEILDFRATVPLIEGLQWTISWFKDNC
ncbi:MAG: NAD-dependent epimerase/dehydratase family protein [Anaerolineae bacterium]|nr:NAD-dependent epimerase/dehydratase family protein [Anaerolineae bacterium]